MTTSRTIIAFTDQKGAGKDTAAKILVESRGYTRVGFADLLKRSAAACFGMPPESWDKLKNDPDAYVGVYRYTFTSSGDTYEPIAATTAREFLQRYGTEAHRDIFGTNFWVENLKLPEGDVVITDCRFQNEAEAVKALGGYICLIRRPDTDSRWAEHPSENGVPLPLIDYSIKNETNIGALWSAVGRMEKDIKRKAQA